MRNFFTLFKLTFLLLLIFNYSSCSTTSSGDDGGGGGTRKVACLGDSITFGTGITSSAAKYPAVLQELLGDGYRVRNFGRSGANVVLKGNNPYQRTSRYSSAKSFNPDIVVVMLGTNDSTNRNAQFSSDFNRDYSALIRDIKGVSNNPKVYVCTIPRAFTTRFGHNPSRVTALSSRARAVAKSTGSSTIDVRGAIGSSSLFSDGIHPNAAGARKIAERVASKIQRKKLKKNLAIMLLPPPLNQIVSKRYEFK